MKIITRQYDTHTIRFIHGDCMEWLNKIGTVTPPYDLAIVDPPYGLGKRLTEGGGSHLKFKNHKEIQDWDIVPSPEYFKQLYDSSKNQIIWGGNYFGLGPTRGFAIWDKLQSVPNFSACEFAWFSFDCPSKIFRLRQAGFIGEKKIHPTQKPVQLYKWLLINYAKEDDHILDTHGGSGSIAIACHLLRYNLDIVEKDEEYFNKMIDRFDRETAQQALIL